MQKQIACIGLGVNSTAMLVGMRERGERPNASLFADTSGEGPWVYEHLRILNEWCESVGFPRIETVRATGKSLEQDCLDRNVLPAIAYGFKTCSLRWKKDPQDKWARNNGFRDAVRLIGIDMDELRRAKEFPLTRYPLIEWGWGRDECIEAIERAGIPQPKKSSCFFCPSTKKQEILLLPKDLQERALKIESGAVLTSAKGLGRSFAWRDIIEADANQQKLFGCEPETPCGCYDG